jgi:hypothetical protein
MRDDERGIPVSQAAKILGISVSAARKRVQRGSLRAYKVDGQWMVVLPMGSGASHDVGTTIAVGRGYDAGKDALIAQLQAENARLWDLVARLAGERAPELPPGPSPAREGAEPMPSMDAPMEPPQTPATPPQRRSWRPAWPWRKRP